MRERWLKAHQCNDQSTINELSRGLKIIQQHWARVADIVHLHLDLAHGGHQERRGGPSLGKAISLIAAKPRARAPVLPNCGRFGRPTRMSRTW